MPKGQKKIRREAKILAAANRRFYITSAVVVGLFGLMFVPILLNVPTGSPEDMVQAQVVRGEKIDSANLPAAASPDKNAPTSLSNSSAAATLTTFSMNPVLVASNTPVMGNADATRRSGPTAIDFNSQPEIIEVAGKKYLNLTFAKLASFPFKVTPEVADVNEMENPGIAARHTREQVPDSVKALSEKPACVTGFMLPVSVVEGRTSDFLLLRNQSACCYGVMPRVNEWVVVRMAGKGIKPIMDVPVTAFGTFHVGEMRENGHLVGIYLLECDQLRPTKFKS